MDLVTVREDGCTIGFVGGGGKFGGKKVGWIRE